MDTPVNQDSLESQKEYFLHLNITSWKGRLYRKYFLYPLLNLFLKGKTLDVGCGLGSFLRSRRGSIGADINPFNVDYCNANGLEAHIIEKNFSFEDEEFDSVILDNVLEHIDDPELTLLEIKRVMKKNGILVIGVPSIAGYKSQADHKVFYDEKSLVGVAKDFGFESTRIFYTPFKSKYLESHMNAHCLYGVFIKK